MSDTFEKGLAIFGDVYGQEMADGCRRGLDAPRDFDALHVKWSMEWAFGSVWTREEQLPRKMRSLAVLGMMIGQRQFEEIKYHTKMALANGLTRREIEEVFLTAMPYCGFPSANTAKQAMIAGFKELEAEGKL